ncbi:MAG: GNAT family N-acetyltransferase [Candidatus Eremiobacteraeota bacterium]|nr:GNAT family N-acetyltransferase [Candidatus Eremiobacteraeota bacterium]
MLERIVTARGRVLRAAGPADIAAIAALEERPEMHRYIGRWGAERHARYLRDPNLRYLVCDDDAGLAGFVILEGLSSIHRAFVLERIAVRVPGQGDGSDMLAAVVAAVFEEANAHRLQLDLYVDNVRARRAYERVGFREEGVLREAAIRDGRFVDLTLMSVLEHERAARSSVPVG